MQTTLLLASCVRLLDEVDAASTLSLQPLMLLLQLRMAAKGMHMLWLPRACTCKQTTNGQLPRSKIALVACST
jgi:hypothetical protein